MVGSIASVTPTSLAFAPFLTAVIKGLNARLPHLKTCELHGGRFNVEELKRLGRQAPALFLSALAAPANTGVGDGRRQIALQLTAFVLASDQRGLPRDVAVLNLVEAVMMTLPQQTWGLPESDTPLRCGFPERISAQNLYSGSLDKVKSALWGVSWRQSVMVGNPAWETGAALAKELYVGIEPETGAPHKEDYEQLV